MKKSRQFHNSHFRTTDKVSGGLLFCSRLHAGEVYLFHKSDPLCPAVGSLWGMYDKRIEDGIYLESSTENLCFFRKWHLLPSCYRYFRLSTRAELRDYMVNLIDRDQVMLHE